MGIIRCPHCGDPVRILGNRWECGFCGDCGILSSLPSWQGEEVELTLQFTIHEVDDGNQKLPPTRERLEELVRRRDFSEYEWADRDLLVMTFPELASHWTAQELEEMDVADLIGETAEFSPETAVKMMKYLLDLEQPHLQEREAATALLGNDLFDACRMSQLQGILLRELKADDRFARALFLSAYAGPPQQELVDACQACGEYVLQQRLQSYLDANPYFDCQEQEI